MTQQIEHQSEVERRARDRIFNRMLPTGTAGSFGVVMMFMLQQMLDPLVNDINEIKRASLDYAKAQMQTAANVEVIAKELPNLREALDRLKGEQELLKKSVEQNTRDIDYINGSPARRR